ncbi:MAG: NAD(P)/FAD-dependent oxidoreductase [Gammaproteobacteria bacterium]|nr:NAD(P)/FAD-dependent oxidoreductase [Gammaproteobacteria bacterium]
MDRCDVLIVGGGPAGSSCAWALRKAGLDVVVMDKMRFPRDKVCAGWITPAVIEALELDSEDYRQQHVFQPISGFRVGRLGGSMLDTQYDHAVSYGIRRCEFDDYLLRRADARLRLGEPLETLSRTQDGWQVNGTLQTPVIVGAGGHFCPVARFLGADVGQRELAVHAQECEYAIDAAEQSAYQVKSEVPELYFCADLKGYGWCVRKGDFINIGLGREDKHGLARHVADFQQFLVTTGRVPADITPRFKGHAYLLYRHARRTLIDDGVLLIGDAAGLAYTESGEGIRPAIESGLLAATTLLQAEGRYSRDALEPYVQRLTARFGTRGARAWTDLLPAGVKSRLAGDLLAKRWFVQHLLLERWFLHTQERPLHITEGIAPGYSAQR